MTMSAVSVYILRWLYAHGKVGNAYTNMRNLRHALPVRLRDKTIINRSIKELRNAQLIIIHKKGNCISLNPHRLSETEVKHILA